MYARWPRDQAALLYAHRHGKRANEQGAHPGSRWVVTAHPLDAGWRRTQDHRTAGRRDEGQKALSADDYRQVFYDLPLRQYISSDLDRKGVSCEQRLFERDLGLSEHLEGRSGGGEEEA